MDEKKEIIHKIMNRALELGMYKEDIVVDGLVATVAQINVRPLRRSRRSATVKKNLVWQQVPDYPIFPLVCQIVVTSMVLLLPWRSRVD